jgi:SulP family sulfate permease
MVTGAAGRLPLVRRLRGYRREWLPRDALAALSVWAVLVPQVLAYAAVAGLPVQYGLYAALAGLAVYPLIGSSRLLVTAPTAPVAAVSAAVVGGLAVPGSPRYVQLSAALAVAAGLVYLALAALRAGWLADFLSRAVLGGFVTGFAVGITIEQLPALLGVPVRPRGFARDLLATLAGLPAADPATLAVGLASLAALLLLRRLAPRVPRALLVAVAATALSVAVDLPAHGVAVTGPVPGGLPAPALPVPGWQDTPALLVGALSVVLVGFSEALAAARSVAGRYHESIRPGAELAAQGAACVAAGLGGGFAVGGSLTKTSVADAAGQRTQVASLLDAGLVLATLLLLASALSHLPVAALGAIVVDAVAGLVDLALLRRYLRVDRGDAAVYVAALAGILLLGVTAGILLGVGLSLTLLVARASDPPLRRLGLDPDTGTYVDAERHPGSVPPEGVLVLRLDGPLFFADAHRFRAEVTALARRYRPAAVVLDMAAVSQTDTEGADVLAALGRALAARGVAVRLTRVESAVLDLWRRAGTLAALGGEGQVYANVHDAVAGRSGDAAG